MDGFGVPVATAIKRFGNTIGFLQPLVEAVSNSLEAGARNIWIHIAVDRTTTLPGESVHKVLSYTVKDDGEGFTAENMESFSTYMSEYKSQYGCKGVGRMGWLKVFQRVHIDSYLDERHVSFVFDENFSRDKFIVRKYDSSKRETEIRFEGVRNTFFHQGKFDLRANADLEEIRAYIEENLFVKLSLLKEKSIELNIFISNDIGESVAPICNESLKFIDKIEFSIKDGDEKENIFYIYYAFFDDGKKNNSAYYCANGRTVMPILDNIVFENLPGNKSSVVLVTSSFFDEHVNDERNEFDIPKSGNNLYCNLSWEQINNRIGIEIENIIIKEFPKIEQENNKIISELIGSHPHLSKYIHSDTSKIKNKDKILSKTKRKYEQEKNAITQKFAKFLNNNILNSDEFYQIVNEITDMSARKLVEYIVYRQQIIFALQKFNENNGKEEHILHNIFMRKGTESIGEIREAYANNLWLFDDKFMTYMYAASDAEIAKYKKALNDISDITGDDGGRTGVLVRPDLTIFFSGDDDSPGRDAIVVEFKACGASLDQKSKVIWEMNRKVQAVRQGIDNINTIWCYTITSFDQKFENTLKAQDFYPLFSNDEKKPIYYRYFQNINAHFHYISLDTILVNVMERNNAFLDIIKNDK